MDPVLISLLFTILGGFLGLAGWLSKRDDKIGSDSQWKGEVSQALKTIQTDTSTIPGMQKELTKVGESTKSAHNRINENNEIYNRRFKEIEAALDRHIHNS